MATRRLPVIQEPTGEDADAAARPPWHWVLIGSGLVVTIWTPLLTVAPALARKITAAGPAAGVAAANPTAILLAATFAFSAVLAGYLLARFGARTRVRHAALAGLLAALEIWALALLGGSFTTVVRVSALLALSGLGAGFCALGAWLRRRKKTPA